MSERTEGKIHYRILILDEDDTRADRLEFSIVRADESAGSPDGIKQILKNYEKVMICHVKNQHQLNSLPNAAGFNVIWIHMGFPDAKDSAIRFYEENPFCYIIPYGDNPAEIFPFLHARPIGYIKDISAVTRVRQELMYIWSIAIEQPQVFRLQSRNAYYDVDMKQIMYCQSQGRKSYLYMDSAYPCEVEKIQDSFTAEWNESNGFLAYEQNMRLDELEEKLDKILFLRVHQSFIVNRKFITGLATRRDGWILLLIGKCGKKVEIPVSERFHSIVKALFDQELQEKSTLGR